MSNDSPPKSISLSPVVATAEKVIVFGSSTGIEANYSGKPVVLLGGAFYYYLDVTYNPMTKEEVLLLITSKLEPKNNLGAIKFGFYLMFMEFQNRFLIR